MTRSEAVLLLLLVILVAGVAFVFFGVELHRFAAHALDNLQVPPQ